MESELVKIHNTLNFTDRRQLTAEIPEQLMVVKHIKPTDVVLEFGGSIGRKTRSKRQRGGNQEEKDNIFLMQLVVMIMTKLKMP